MSSGKLADNRKISIIQIYKGLSYKDSLFRCIKLRIKNEKLWRKVSSSNNSKSRKGIGIFRKKYNEQKFSEYTYLSKDFNSYKFTNELKNLFDSTIMIKLDLSE